VIYIYILLYIMELVKSDVIISTLFVSLLLAMYPILHTLLHTPLHTHDIIPDTAEALSIGFIHDLSFAAILIHKHIITIAETK